MTQRAPKRTTGRPMREARQLILRVGQMSCEGLPDQRIMILNISPRGMGCRAVYPPALDSAAYFLLGPFGAAKGRICWLQGDRFGVRLDDQVDCLAIRFTKHGFRSLDYDLTRSEAFEGLLLSELFRSGELR